MAVMEHVDSAARNKKNCLRCGKELPLRYEKDYCKNCEEAILFDEVRDYIRDNNVTESEVAEYFGIPKQKVKEWIRDGRVEYSGGKGL